MEKRSAEVTEPEYASRQLEALAWLPADGAWREDAADDQTLTKNLLHLFYVTSLVEFDDDAPLANPERFCLTPSGVAERARLVAEGKIK